MSTDEQEFESVCVAADAVIEMLEARFADDRALVPAALASALTLHVMDNLDLDERAAIVESIAFMLTKFDSRGEAAQAAMDAVTSATRTIETLSGPRLRLVKQEATDAGR